jgi:hypothetical protein
MSVLAAVYAVMAVYEAVLAVALPAFWPAILAGLLVVAGVGLLLADGTAWTVARWLHRLARPRTAGTAERAARHG